jgi:phosphate-selective porin OprO/OprP
MLSSKSIRISLFAAFVLGGGHWAQAQDPPLPPTPAVDPTAASSAEERLQKLEEDNRRLMEMFKQLSAQNAEMARQNAEMAKRLELSPAPAANTEAGSPQPGSESIGEHQTGEADDEGDALSVRAQRGIGAQGTGARVFVPESQSRGSEKLKKRKALVEFGEGLELSSDDGEFKLQFHNLTQAEFRNFVPTPGSNSILHSQFFIPRQRWYFTGNVSKNIEYYTVINRGYGSLDLLDAFISFRFDPRLRLRVGRMKTPYLYEYYQIAEGDLIAPERSLYAGNFADNRQNGAMFLGELFENRMGYAIGAFNGQRRSFNDTNSAKDLFIFLNSRPFLKPEDGAGVRGAEGTGGRTRPNQAIMASDGEPREPGLLEYLNLGSSFNIGYENGVPQPAYLTTANDQTVNTNLNTVDSLSPTFFVFNSNTVENGMRAQWSAHAAWYYKSLMVLAEYGAGYGGYSLAGKPYSTSLPYSGYNVTATYFLTGERLTRRVNVVKPRHDFKFRNGKITGPGAIEVYGRFAELALSEKAFSSGFADPNLWSNQAQTLDLGLNWYLNFYTKIYLDWQHSMFGTPVLAGPGQYRSTQNLLWLRFQIFF